MGESKLYVGAKIIKAQPMTAHAFYTKVKSQPYDSENQDGYMVEYPDNYKSWSPKAVFETAYREVSTPEKELF